MTPSGGVFRINGYNSVRRINTRRVSAAAGGWWLSGGISPSIALGAYQGVGVADLATSFIDLTGNGNTASSYNESYTQPWDTNNGWYHQRDGDNDYVISAVRTGINFANSGYSFAIRATLNAGSLSTFDEIFGVTNNDASANVSVGNKIIVRTDGSGQYTLFTDNGNLSSSVVAEPSNLNGTWVYTNNKLYYNGVEIAEVLGSQFNIGVEFMVGMVNEFIGSYDMAGAYTQAFSVYSGGLTPAYVSALTTAMNAL